MTQRILFFTTGPVPTEAEQNQIDALNGITSPAFSVGIRNASQTTHFQDNLEACDWVAGSIPTAYAGVADYGTPNDARPLALATIPESSTAAPLGTQQLQVISVEGQDASDLQVSDVTATNTTYETDDAGIATVSVGGLITAVAVGVVVIRAIHEYATGLTITVEHTITVSV